MILLENNSKKYILYLLFGYLTTLIAIYFFSESGAKNVYNFFRFILFPIYSLVVFNKVINCYENNNIIKWPNFNWVHVLIALCIFYIVLLGLMKFIKASTEHFYLFDYGLYVNKVWRLANMKFTEAIFVASTEGHFQPIVYLYSLIFRITNSFNAVMIVETLTLSATSLIVYVFAKSSNLEDFPSFLIGLAFLINPLLSMNDILGFHPDHFVIPMFFVTLLLFRYDKFYTAIIPSSIICLCGEQWILTSCALWLYAVIRYRRPCFSGIVFGIYLSIFFVVISVVLGVSASNNSLEYLTAESSPFYYASIFDFIINLTEPKKIFFLLFVFSPLLALRNIDKRGIVLILPDLVKILGARDSLIYSVEGHYTLPILGAIIVIFIESVRFRNPFQISSNTMRFAFLTLILSTIHGPLPYSFDFITNISSNIYNYKNYINDAETESKKLIRKIVSENSNLSVSITNSSYYSTLGYRYNLRLLDSCNLTSNYIIDQKYGTKGMGSALNTPFMLSKCLLTEYDYVSIFEDKNFSIYYRR